MNHFYQGLPAGEIDSDDLNAEQQILLGIAVEAGVYAPIKPTTRKGRKDGGDELAKEDRTAPETGDQKTNESA